MENDFLRENLNPDKHERVKRENEIMKMELRNKFILDEEHKDLTKDINDLKLQSYDERYETMKKENEILKRRVGELLIKLDEEEKKHQKLEKSFVNT
jgi:hypothetical protein